MSRSILAQLRDIVPIRPLSRPEALQIAERQALKLLELSGISDVPVPERIISELPRIDVRRISPFPVSGATHWVNGSWAIVVNGAEPITRQRFSLAHELKHVIDHRFIHVLYTGEPDPDERHRWIESTCDYFAGCLLVPRPALKRIWATETQSVAALAKRFHVSHAAMQTRLAQVGLGEPSARCDGRHGDQKTRRGGRIYFRSSGRPVVAGAAA